MIVVFWKVEDSDRKAEDLDTYETEGKARRRFLLRYEGQGLGGHPGPWQTLNS